MMRNTIRFQLALACALLMTSAVSWAQVDHYLISVKVHVNGRLVAVQYGSGLEVNGACGDAEVHDAEGVEDGVLQIDACDGDTLVFVIDPAAYGTGMSLDCWAIDGHCVGSDTSYAHCPTQSETIAVRLLGVPTTDVRDPVSPRWAPDAGCRAGEGLLWGPTCQAISKAVDDPKASMYPALLYSGEAFEKQVDFAVAGRGLDFVWSRVHRSGASGGLHLGGEWIHNFDLAVESGEEHPLQSVQVRMGNGTTKTFSYSHHDTTIRYFYAPGWDAELRFAEDSKYLPTRFWLVFGDGVTWWFDVFDYELGAHVSKLTSIEDRFGNALTFAYDAQERLETITDTLGRTYTVAYNLDDTIASLTENGGLGRSIAYTYDAGDLSTVTYPGGDTIEYTYDAEGRLLTVTDSRGNVSLTNTYTGGLLTSQQHGSGPEAGTVTLEYTGLTLESGEARATRTTDAAGHVVEHFFNDFNQLVRRCEVGPDETYTTRIAWESNAFGSETVSDDIPTLVTLPDGVTIAYEYAGPGTGSAYTRRMNLTRIERLANDSSGDKTVTIVTHDDGLPFWDARFGESFVTRREVRDRRNALLEGDTYTYSTDGLATLDGIDYDGLPAYAAPNHHEEFAYNAQGQVTEHVHPENPVSGDAHHRRRDTFAYTNGYLTAQVMDAGGLALKTSFEPDAVGRVVKTATPAAHSGGVPIEARKTLMQWTDLDRVDEVEYPQTSAAVTRRPATSFEYDDNGNVTCIQRALFDEDGSDVTFGNAIDDPEDGGDALVAVRFDYDTRNRVTHARRETDSVKNVTAYHYDENGNIVKVETPLATAGTEPDDVVECEYDARDLPTRIVRSGQVVTRLDYDAMGRLTRQIEGYSTPEARGWEYAYDGLGRLASDTDPGGLETQYERDALGRVTRMDAVGPDADLLARTDYGYDLAGRLTDVDAMHKDADGANIGDGWSRVDLDFSDAGQLLSRSVEGTATEYVYDTAARVASVTAPTGDAVEYAYDADGRVTHMTEAALDSASKADTDFETEYEYDPLGRVVEARILGGATPNTAGYAYDSLGRPVRETDGRGNVTGYAYDPLNRLTEAVHDTAGVNAAQMYGYDANGRLTVEIGPNSNETFHTYDALGRPVRTTHADGTAEAFSEYDAVGNLREHVAPNGLITRREYDALGRPVAESFDHLAGRSDPGATSYEYDALGRLVATENGASAVTRRYDSLGNLTEETLTPEGGTPYTTSSLHNNKGFRTQFDPPGGSNTVIYTRDAAGRVTHVEQNGAGVATFDYLGGRITARHLGNGTDTALDYDPTGRRVAAIIHSDGSKAALDARTYSWDGAYNLDDYQVTGGPLASGVVNYAYDGLNRLDPASISAGWTLDGAGNRTGSGYTMTGRDALMHRYTTSSAGQTRHYDAAGALCTVAESKWHRYDALGRLVEYEESTAATTTSLAIEPGDCTVLAGTWNWNTGDGGYLEETSAAVGAILRTLPAASQTLTVQYRSSHDPNDPDGDSNTDEADGDDYADKYYAQILLAVDLSHAGESPPYYPYLALRIAPDRFALIAYDGTEDVEELDSADIETAQNMWYTVHAVFDDGDVQVYRTSETPGDPVAELSGESDLLDGLGGVVETAGFAVGAAAGYHFRSFGYATTGTTSTAHVAWTYDPFGRKVGRTVYDGSGAVTSETHYVYDGWRLVQERDADTGTVLAEYTYGPGYIDDVLRSSRGGQEYYHHTDQQHSTIALTNAAGAVVERYAYDAFGAPTVCDSAGTPIGTSAVDNPVLYTGRTWDPALNLYDYRNRQYDPALGRFTTPDPLGPNADWNNLGNPYTYTGANPGAFVDPFGLQPSFVLPIEAAEAVSSPEYIAVQNAAWAGFFSFGGSDYESMEELASMAPVVGWIADVDIIQREFRRGDYLSAGVGFFGLVPIIGDAASGVFRAAHKGVDAGIAARKSVKVSASAAADAAARRAGKQATQVADDASDAGSALSNAARKGRPRKVGEVTTGTLRRRLREDLARVVPRPSPTAQAHHIFPLEFRYRFRNIGVDFSNAKYGTWWEGPEHSSMSRAWNREWREWFERLDRERISATPQMAIDKARDMAIRVGLTIYF